MWGIIGCIWQQVLKREQVCNPLLSRAFLVTEFPKGLALVQQITAQLRTNIYWFKHARTKINTLNLQKISFHIILFSNLYFLGSTVFKNHTIKLCYFSYRLLAFTFYTWNCTACWSFFVIYLIPKNSHFLEWQPCYSSVLVLCSSRAIYQGFCQ